jgi:hypothetical protein
VTRYGHRVPCKHIEVVEASHRFQTWPGVRRLSASSRWHRV